MSTPYPEFVGPSYCLQNPYAAIERTANWILIANESEREEKKFDLSFDPAPGNQPFSVLPVPFPFNQPNRGLLELRGKVFGVNGNVVFSLDKNGNYTLIGNVVDDKKPASMVANGNDQVFIASGGKGYVIPSGGGVNSLQAIGGGDFLGASYATFQDGYVIVITPNSNQFQISGSDSAPLGDATQWDAANVSVQAGQADLLSACISSREYLRLLGQRRSQVYEDVGAQGIGAFPFQSYNETFIETGIAAPFSLADMGDSLIWIGQDARGMRACWRDSAFQPQRISTFAVEQAWQSYVQVSDAVAFAYIWNGCLIWRVTFPTAVINDPARFPLGTPPTYSARTWEYNATTSALLNRAVWTEPQYLNSFGTLIGRPELFHCYAYGLHLAGSGGTDGNPGAVYQYGNVGTTNENPQLLLRWSNNAGKSYGPEQQIPVGLIGQDMPGEGLGAYCNRTGYARDRVFWLRYSEDSECGTNLAGAQVRVSMVRDRISPHLWKNRKRRIYNRIQFETAWGVGSEDGKTPAPNSLGIVTAELDLVECSS